MQSRLEAKVSERTSEVRREKEQAEAILRSVADGIFVLGNHSEIVLTNPAGRRSKHERPKYAMRRLSWVL